MGYEVARVLPKNVISFDGDRIVRRRKLREKLGWYPSPKNKAKEYSFEKAKLSGEFIGSIKKELDAVIKLGASRLIEASTDISSHKNFILFNDSIPEGVKQVWIIYFRGVDITGLERQIINDKRGKMHTVIEVFKFTRKARNLQYSTTSSLLDDLGRLESKEEKKSYKNNSTSVSMSRQLVKEFTGAVDSACKS